MLDDINQLIQTDQGNFFSQLQALPGSYDGPDGERPEPYGLIGFGEGSGLGRALTSWVDAPLVVSGTQFMLAGGFDDDELAPLKLNCELAGADVIVLGHSAHEPDLQVPRGILSRYQYICYLAHATKHSEALGQAEAVMSAWRDQCLPEIKTERNPAKTLAWALWNRVPLLLAGRADSGAADLIQRVFARVAGVLAITTGEHPLEVLSSALESRHRLGDDVVAVSIGPDTPEVQLAKEVLETRVAQIERLSLPEESSKLSDPGARALALWYASLWVAGYLSALHEKPPADAPVYDKVASAAHR